MRNLSRRLERLEAATPPPEVEWTVKRRELIERMLSSEIDVLEEALENLKDGAATEEDHETIRAMFTLAHERLEAGLIIVRERKPPEQWNEEMREALRMQRQTGQPWQSIGNYNEFLVEADYANSV